MARMRVIVCLRALLPKLHLKSNIAESRSDKFASAHSVSLLYIGAFAYGSSGSASSFRAQPIESYFVAIRL